MEGNSTPKRYVLLIADSDLAEGDRKEATRVLELRYGAVKVIAVQGSGRALIVKTDNQGAAGLRGLEGGLRVGRARLRTVLTSGAIGKLKREAAGVEDNGQVHE